MDVRSLEFLDKAVSCRYELVISDMVIQEIKKKTLLSDNDVNKFIERYASKLTLVIPDDAVVAEAVKLNRRLHTGFADCLHYLLSKDLECIVTWNTRHFPNGKTPAEM
jgi:predicted nucleic acid-binding protein